MTSPKTLYRLSLAALLLHMLRGFLDLQFIYPEMLGANVAGTAGVYAFYALAFGLWIHSLPATQSGEKRGLRIMLAFNLLFTLGVSLGTATTYCPTPCETAAPLSDILNWGSLLVGLVAAWAMFQRTRE